MKIIYIMILLCLLIQCSNNKEKKEKAKTNYFLCTIIARKMDPDTTVALVTACVFKYSDAFKDDESLIPFQ